MEGRQRNWMDSLTNVVVVVKITNRCTTTATAAAAAAKEVKRMAKNPFHFA